MDEINALKEMGVDLNQINLSNIQEFNSLAQMSQNMGGLDNITELLQNQTQQEQDPDSP